jgi:hypothetical protein
MFLKSLHKDLAVAQMLIQQESYLPFSKILQPALNAQVLKFIIMTLADVK